MAMAPPTASPMPPDGSATMDSAGSMDGTEHVVLTVCRSADGTWIIYPGDEPDDSGPTAGGADDMSEDDADAMGAAGGAAPGGSGAGAGGGGPMAGGPPGSMIGGGSGGKTANSIGAALKIQMDIMQADESGGGPGDADAQFAAGYSADKTPTPMGSGLKYPSAA